MFGSWVLEVAVGLIFVFLLFSTICAAIREGIEAWTKTRAAYLERGIREMLHDMDGSDLARKFYEHPLIYSLYAGKYEPGQRGERGKFERGGVLPSYIPAKNFAAAMMDLAARGPLPGLSAGSHTDDPGLSGGPITIESLRSGIALMENKRVARAMLSALDQAQDDLNKARLNLEAWYDGTMDRVSGWYKRSTQWIVFGIAFIIAGVLNVDAIGIANFLYRNDNARQRIVAEAEQAVARGKPVVTAAASDGAPTAGQQYGPAKATLESLELPIGWDGPIGCAAGEDGGRCVGRGLLIFLGWLLTALAATLGAPFWFDILNKVMVIRSTVKPYEKSKPEGSEDRQNLDQSLALAAMMRPSAAAPAPAAATARGAAAPMPDHEDEIDGCRPGDDPLTPDDQLPPADGGVLR